MLIKILKLFLNRHCEERSDAAIQKNQRLLSGLLRHARNDGEERRKKNKTSDKTVKVLSALSTTLLGLYKSFGIDLFSRTVASQVFSAMASLTSVFGMGTGGTSPLMTPNICYFATTKNIIPKHNPFVKRFSKNNSKIFIFVAFTEFI